MKKSPNILPHWSATCGPAVLLWLGIVHQSSSALARKNRNVRLRHRRSAGRLVGRSVGVRPQRACRGKPCAVVCGAAAGSSRTGSSRSRSLAGTPRPLLLDSRSPRELQPAGAQEGRGVGGGEERRGGEGGEERREGEEERGGAEGRGKRRGEARRRGEQMR